jgi:transposase
MPWTEITRAQYQRNGLRYASDMTDAEWRLIARKLPTRRRLGRPREVDLRKVVEAILFILSTGCQWRALPREFPPYSTVQGYFYAWRDTGRWHRIVKALVRQARRKLGRKPTPTAAVIDSQTASTTQAGGPRGFDPGKRVHGRKRHIVTQRSLAGRPCSSRQCSGRPWCGPLAGTRAKPLSKAAARLCRPGLSRKAARRRALPLWPVGYRDRPATARGQRLPTPATTLGRRAHFCMVRQVPPTLPRLRRLRLNRGGLASRSPSQALDPAPRQALKLLTAF